MSKVISYRLLVITCGGERIRPILIPI